MGTKPPGEMQYSHLSAGLGVLDRAAVTPVTEGAAVKRATTLGVDGD